MPDAWWGLNILSLRVTHLTHLGACDCVCGPGCCLVIVSQYSPGLNPTLCLSLEQWTNTTFVHLKIMLSSLLLSHNFMLIYKILCSYSPPTSLSSYPSPTPLVPKKVLSYFGSVVHVHIRVCLHLISANLQEHGSGLFSLAQATKRWPYH